MNYVHFARDYEKQIYKFIAYCVKIYRELPINLRRVRMKEKVLKKKTLNITFYSLFFLASLLGEAYCLVNLKDDIFSMLGIGIIVLIAGYLLIDCILYELEAHNRKEKEEREKLLKGLFMALNQNLEKKIK